MIETGLFISFGIASDIRWSSRHEQSFDVLDRGEGARFRSHPSFLRGGVAFVDQTLDVNLAERDVSVLIDARDRNRAGGDHGSPCQFALLFEIFDHLINIRRGKSAEISALSLLRAAPKHAWRADA